MCGRYVLEKPDLINRRFKIKNKLPLYEPNYNVTPGLSAPVIIKKSPNSCELMDWGFVPDWMEEAKFKTINARDDSLDKNFYKGAFAQNRCLVPASGFYEWKKIELDGKETKIPYFIRLKEVELFGLAGIFGEQRFAIITTKPNSVMAKIHNRMPVIIEVKDEEVWLNRESEIEVVKNLVQPIEPSKMTGWRVSRAVNDPKNNNKNLIEKVS